MITISLPLLKLWFWVFLIGAIVAFCIAIAFVLDALTLRKRMIQRIDQWAKQREHFK